MPSLLLLAAGTRGTVEPIIALSKSLVKSPTLPFTSVHLCIPEEYVVLAPSRPSHDKLHLLTPACLSLKSMLNVLNNHMPKKNASTNNPLSSQVCAVGALTEHCVTPLIPYLRDVITTFQVNTIVTTTLGVMVCNMLVSSLSCIRRVFAVHYQPFLFSSVFPCYLSSLPDAKTAAKLLTNGVIHPPKDINQSRSLFPRVP